jgi:MFS family permease
VSRRSDRLSHPLTPDRLRRRYLLLRFLGYLPLGLLVPVLTLLLVERGLTLTTIGVVLTGQGLVVLLAELPTGGLADAVGRRPVLLAATGASATSYGLVIAAGEHVGLLFFALMVAGLHRALESGPLDAWFVDAALEAGAASRVEPTLATAGVLVGAAMALGSLLSAGLVAWAPFGVEVALTVPLAVALGLRLAELVLIATTMVERRPEVDRARLVVVVGQVPQVVRRSIALAKGSTAVVALLAVEVLWGVGSAAYEVLTPVRLAELLDGTDVAATWMGPVSAGGWAVVAVGSACVRPLVRWLGATGTGVLLRVLQGGAVVAMGVVAGPAGLVVAYLVNYGAHGAANPVHMMLLHREATGDLRATLLSVNSMAALGPGALGTLAIGWLADATATSTAIVAGGLVLAVSAPLYLVVRRRGAPPLAERDTAVASP